MSAECYPVSVLPHLSKLYADYLALPESAGRLASWYSSAPLGRAWMAPAQMPADQVPADQVPADQNSSDQRSGAPHRETLANLLHAQATEFAAAPAAFANIDLLRSGARAVVTGQQVGLFGGPLLTLLKAATAVARAREATAVSGVPHVPVFWCATEDHDLAEVDHAALLGKRSLEVLRLPLEGGAREVGSLPLGDGIEALLEEAAALLGDAPVCELLRACYRPSATLGGAFAELMTRLFAAHGLVVMDASTRGFHHLGAPVLRAALERAEALEQALLQRTGELEAAGYEAQVLVRPGASLLFLIDEKTGARLPLKRSGQAWVAGGQTYSLPQLLEVLEQTPERLSPNALLRPVFQDAILPTAAYIGGPAEIAYFAQSAVLYEAIAGQITPVLPRLSATLIEPEIGSIMSGHEVSLDAIFAAKTSEELTLRLAARAMPTEGKRRLASAGNAMDAELNALTTYLGGMDASLGRAAGVSASKMRYQMNRLRRMAARFEAEREASLRKHAEALLLHLFPDAHVQERLLAGVWFLAQAQDFTGLIDLLVEEAGTMCTGHAVIRL